MVKTLESIRGGGGSIKVGTTGTIGALMSRELETAKAASQTPALCKKKSPVICSSLQSEASTPRRKSQPSDGGEGSSSSNKQVDRKDTETRKKTKQYSSKTQQIPILSADNVSIDRTPIRHKSGRKGSYIVEIVDIKCGNQDRAWASPIATRLKKLGFSKLSESII